MRDLTTRRLALLPLSRELIEARLGLGPDEPGTDVTMAAAGPVRVHVPRTWPGDLLPVLPHLLQGIGEGRSTVEGSWAVVLLEPDRAEGAAARGEAIGAVGTKGHVIDGGVEIGYGLDEAHHGRGLGTEAVGAVVRELMSHHGVERVEAETDTANVASRRLLARLGFVQVDEYAGHDRGSRVRLIRWRLTRTPG